MKIINNNKSIHIAKIIFCLFAVISCASNTNKYIKYCNKKSTASVSTKKKKKRRKEKIKSGSSRKIHKKNKKKKRSFLKKLTWEGKGAKIASLINRKKQGKTTINFLADTDKDKNITKIECTRQKKGGKRSLSLSTRTRSLTNTTFFNLRKTVMYILVTCIFIVAVKKFFFGEKKSKEEEDQRISYEKKLKEARKMLDKIKPLEGYDESKVKKEIDNIEKTLKHRLKIARKNNCLYYKISKELLDNILNKQKDSLKYRYEEFSSNKKEYKKILDIMKKSDNDESIKSEIVEFDKNLSNVLIEKFSETDFNDFNYDYDFNNIIGLAKYYMEAKDKLQNIAVDNNIDIYDNNNTNNAFNKHNKYLIKQRFSATLSEPYKGHVQNTLDKLNNKIINKINEIKEQGTLDRKLTIITEVLSILHKYIKNIITPDDNLEAGKLQSEISDTDLYECSYTVNATLNTQLRDICNLINSLNSENNSNNLSKLRDKIPRFLNKCLNLLLDSDEK